MTQLTKEEIEMIEKDAKWYHSTIEYTSSTIMGYRAAATKYLLQLKEERERAGKLTKALEWVSSRTQELGVKMVIETAIHNYKNPE